MTNKLILSSSGMPPISSFEAYKSYVNRIPQITEEEELKLLTQFKEGNCIESAQKLILSQLKTVLTLSYKYKGYGLPQEDLVQEGNIGLMKAVKNFDLAHKVRLYTYAIIWIKSEIQSYIIKNWKLVKIATTKNLKKLFFGFKETQKELIDYGVSRQQIIKDVATKLGVPEEDVREMQNYFANDDLSINYEDEESPAFQIPYTITPEDEYEEKHDKNFYSLQLENGISELNDKQKQVIQYRYYNEEKLTHKEIGAILKISSERVRQIENEALLKLKKLIT